MVFPTHIVAVGALVLDERDQVLLVRHRRRGWEFPGGQVEVGETLLEALAREVKEETGIDIRVERLAGIHSNVAIIPAHDASPEIPTKVMLDFAAVATSGDLQVSSEHVEVGWFEKDVARSMITHPVLRRRFEYLLEAGSHGIVYTAYTTEPFVLHLTTSV